MRNVSFASKRRPDDPAPPAWAMPAAIGLVLVLVACAGAIFRAAERDHASRPYTGTSRLGRSLDLPPRQSPGVPRVVVVSSSLLDAATLPDREIEALAERSGSLRVQYDTLARAHCRIPDWDAAVRLIEAAAPTVVVLDAYCVAYEPRWLPIRSGEFWGFWSARLRGWLHPGAVAAASRTSGEPVPEVPGGDWSEDAVSKAREARVTTEAIATDAGIRRRLVSFRRTGVRVVVVDVPLHEIGTRGRGAGRLQALERCLRLVDAERLATVVRCRERFERTDYMDPTHLGARGRETFSRWLVCRLGQWVRP